MSLVQFREKKKAYSATYARNNFAELINEAIYRGPVFVRKHKQEVAIISAELFNALTELESNNQ